MQGTLQLATVSPDVEYGCGLARTSAPSRWTAFACPSLASSSAVFSTGAPTLTKRESSPVSMYLPRATSGSYRQSRGGAEMAGGRAGWKCEACSLSPRGVCTHPDPFASSAFHSTRSFGRGSFSLVRCSGPRASFSSS